MEEKRRQRLEEDKVWEGLPCSILPGAAGCGVGDRSRLVVDSVAAGTLTSPVSRGNLMRITA